MQLSLRTHHDFLERHAQPRVADVLLAHQVVVNARLCVSDDQEGAAHLTHLHLLLLGGGQLCCL